MKSEKIRDLLAVWFAGIVLGVGASCILAWQDIQYEKQQAKEVAHAQIVVHHLKQQVRQNRDILERIDARK